MKAISRNVAGAVLFFLFGAGIMWGAARLPFGTIRQPGAGAFPLAIGLALMVLGAALALPRQTVPAVPAEDAGEGQPEPWGRTRVAAICAMIAVYVLILPAAGFLAATMVLMVALYAAGAERGFGLRPLIAGVLTAAAAYVLFVWLLAVPLPYGWLWER